MDAGAPINSMLLSHYNPTSSSSSKSPRSSFEPDTEKIKQRLIKKGVFPTPKIIHTVRKKEIQKSLRKSKPSLETHQEKAQRQAMAEQSILQTVAREYRTVSKELECKNGVLPAGKKPWEIGKGLDLRGISSFDEGYVGEKKLKGEHLEELREILVQRNVDDFQWLLDDDLEEGGDHEPRKASPARRRFDDQDRIRLLVHRLSATNLSRSDWKFSRLMGQSGILFTERYLLKIIHSLGASGNWRHALSVVEWVYMTKDYKDHKSRFVYTKLLAVLGKARRPSEALRIFNRMREDYHLYPDMPAYHSIAVTLGQAGLVKELLNTIECMRQRPSKRILNARRTNWDPRLEADVVVYNALLNACVPSRHWKGVFWVLGQMRLNNLKPSGATYGLAMEVMLKSGKYDLVHNFFEKMRRSGMAPKALTYKVLVRSLWEQGRVNEAVEAVDDMERRGVVGTASVYYELACCLCNNGRWKDSIVQVNKLKKLHHTRPLEVAFTGMIQSSMDGGHLGDCISIFEYMKEHCTPNIGTVNVMLKVYSRSDMFMKAKQLFEAAKQAKSSLETLPDLHSYSSMLEASATSLQWEYFEYVYKEMTLCGYQLDQNKHAWLLIEASKAGKWHLLEHAFDTILEAGEIPHLLLFTEMICQTVVRHDYRRTVILINSMGHASLHVSQQQWTYLLSRRDGISKEELCSLLMFLHNSDILLSEATVSNLLKSLNSICGSNAFSKDEKKFLPGAGHSDVVVDASSYKDNEQEDSFADLPYVNGGVATDRFSLFLNDRDDIEEDSISEKSTSLTVDRDRNSSSFDYTEDDFDDVASGLSTGCIDDDRVYDSLDSVLPSVPEILDTWKKSRNKDVSSSSLNFDD